MVLFINAADTSFANIVKGDFSFTEALLRTLGTFSFSNNASAGNLVDDSGNTISYWDVTQTAKFEIDKFSIGDISYSFDKILFESIREERVFDDPNPLQNLTLPTTTREALMQMRYKYTGSGGRDFFDFSGSVGGTAHGGLGWDRLTGGLGDDNLYGGEGSDVLSGGGGHDLLDGGNGDDTIFGSLGQRLIGGAGTDLLHLDLSSMTSDFDYVAAIQRSTGLWLTEDTWVKGFEAFDFKLGSGDDRFDLSGLQFDTYMYMPSALDAGKGTDSLVFDWRTGFALEKVRNVELLTIDFSGGSTWNHVSMSAGRSGADLNFRGIDMSGVQSVNVTGGITNDTIVGVAGNDQLTGGAGDDTITGRGGEDIIRGGSGDDTVYGSTGSSMDGGSGTDTLIFDLSSLTTRLVFRFADQKTDWLTIAPDTTIRNFDKLSLSLGRGNDIVDLRGAHSKGGNYYGGGGIDTFKIDSSSVVSTNGAALTIDRFEQVNIDLSDSKRAVYSIGEGSIVYFEAYINTFIVKNYSTLNISLGSSDDEFAGTAKRDIVRGNEGDDIIKGGKGIDFLAGGEGNDVIYGSIGSVLAGGAGTDTLYIDRSSIKTSQRFEANRQADGVLYFDDGTRISGFERIMTTFGAGDDRIDVRGISSGTLDPGRAMSFHGGKGRDVFDADHTTRGRYEITSVETLNLDFSGSGKAVSMAYSYGPRFKTFSTSSMELNLSGASKFNVEGTLFADTLRGDIRSDSLAGGAGDDLLLGGRGNDVLRGGSGADGLEGGRGRDQLVGSSGNDILFGGKDSDVLTGGSGQDLFLFSAWDGKDTVTDFVATGSKHDFVDLSTSDSITSYDDLTENHMKQIGADVFIDALYGHGILLQNVKLAALDERDFVF